MNSVCIAKPQKSSPYWIERHEEITNEKELKTVNVLFTGDSMIEYMQYNETWVKKILPLGCLNHAIAGEGIDNLLFRLENGALDSIKAKVIVYMIGTNNILSQRTNVDDITAGILKVGQTMRLMQPEALIVTLGIPPKGREQNSSRSLIDQVNGKIEEAIESNGDGNWKYLCCHDGFIKKDNGELYKEYYTDWLHFSEIGYEKFCEPLINYLKNVLK